MTAVTRWPLAIVAGLLLAACEPTYVSPGSSPPGAAP